MFGEEGRLTFFSRASALDVGGVCAAFVLEKNDASQLLNCIQNTMPFMALLKLAHLYSVFLLTWRTDELSYQAMNGEVQASPSQRTGVAGGAGEEQGEHEQWAQAGHRFPPAKYFGRPDAVQAQVVK